MASAITSLPWVADGIDEAERQVVQGLLDIEVLFGTDSAPALANKPWVVDGLNEHEFTVIETLTKLAESAEEAAKQILEMAFLATFEPSDADTVEVLAGLAGRDRTLFNAMVDRPWLDDGLDEAEKLLLQKLEAIAELHTAPDLWIATFVDSTGPNSPSDKALVYRYDVDESGGIEHAEALLAVRDYADAEINDDQFADIVALYAFTEALIQTPQLMDLVMATSWHQDGIVEEDIYYTEPRAFRALQEIADTHPELAETLLGWPWIFDDQLVIEEASVLEYMLDIDEQSPELTQIIVKLPWLADNIGDWEATAMSRLSELALAGQLDFAMELASTPWVTDGVTSQETQFGIGSLVGIALNVDVGRPGPDIARHLMSLISQPPGDLDLRLLASLDELLRYQPDSFERLLEEPWFVDGLNEEERMYLIAIAGSAEKKRIFSPYFVEHKAIELPLTGTVNLWAVGHGEVSPRLNILAEMEKAVRGSEQFWGLSFPTENVILVLFTQSKGGGVHSGKMMHLGAREGSLSPSTVYHETAHYYFNQGPSWFKEGGAEVIESYIENNGLILTVAIPDYCAKEGFNNLHDFHTRRYEKRLFYCRYPMGHRFLVTLRNVMGGDAWLSALRAFYLEFIDEARNLGIFHDQQQHPDDQDVYRVFLEHTPPELVEEVQDVFRRLHGGPFIDQEG